ncbi:MAG: hypothetical protein KAS88_06175, partial [Deltaproteobacteria bacterium]|nr:hypothetical protein [Deltaproteobacteria bacterium]
ASFLDDFKPVTVRMAKEQGLALNPLKISGVCGRLMCCLSYEHDGSAKKRGGKKTGSKARDGQRDSRGQSRCCSNKKESGEGSCACPSKRTDRKDGDKPRKLQGDIHMDGASLGAESKGADVRKDSNKRERGGRDRGGRGGKGRPDRREKIKDPRKAPLKADVHMEGVVPDAMSTKEKPSANNQRTDGQKPDSQRPENQRPDSQRPDSQKTDSQRADGQPKRRSRRRGRRRGFRKSREGGGGTSSSGSSSGGSSTGGSNDS